MENTQAARDRAAIELLRFLMEKKVISDNEYISIEELNSVLMVADKRVVVPETEKELEVM